MARTDAQKAANAARMRAYRAKKAAQAQQTPNSGMGTPGVVPEEGQVVTPGAGGGSPALEVEVKVDAPSQPPKRSLKDRLFGGAKSQPQSASKPAQKPKTVGKRQENALLKKLPNMLASLIAIYAQRALPDPYKPCAPTKDEADAIIGPLMDIVSRRVEVTAKVSQDAMDLMTAFVCAVGYGARAYITYVQIKNGKDPHAEEERKRAEYRASLEREAREYNEVINDSGERGAAAPEPSLAGGLRAYQAASSGAYRNTVGNDGGRPVESVPGAASNGSGNPADDPELRRAEATAISELFRRDRLGRQQMGLLPRAI